MAVSVGVGIHPLVGAQPRKKRKKKEEKKREKEKKGKKKKREKKRNSGSRVFVGQMWRVQLRNLPARMPGKGVPEKFRKERRATEPSIMLGASHQSRLGEGGNRNPRESHIIHPRGREKRRV